MRHIDLAKERGADAPVKVRRPDFAGAHRRAEQVVRLFGLLQHRPARGALRQVRLGETAADGEVEVLAGLQAGERIALDPVQAGMAVKK